MQICWLPFLLLLVPGCKPGSKAGDTYREIEFEQPVSVEMKGYNGNIMEPFLSRDGNMLLFNNLNSVPENTNLHWATKINDTSFQYQGEITGVNTIDLEAVPTLDNNGNLFFVSTRNYTATLSTLYQCNFLNGKAKNVQLAAGVSKLQAGWVNFDVEVSADGQFLFFVDAQFDQSGNPATADLIIAQKSGPGFQRLSNSSTTLEAINTGALEYAACISADELELYFTRVTVPFTAASSPEIFVSTRQNKNESFGSPTIIKSITGFSEAPTISPDQQTLYYHKKENNKFVLYMARKK
jgi:hypothetical protein